MENKIILIILLAVVGLIVLYLIKAKKAGKKCIGCPYACSCEKKICKERKKAWKNKPFSIDFYCLCDKIILDIA